MKTPVDYSASLEVVLELDAEVGESPYWDPASRTLSCVESFGGTIYVYSPESGQLRQGAAGCEIGAAVPRKRGGFVATSAQGLLALDSLASAPRLLVPVEGDLPHNRMNDGKCDSRGRLWTGTFSTALKSVAGTLYRIDPDLSVHKALQGVHISNGMAWSPDEKYFYYCDTGKRTVYRFDYDIDSGELSNQRVFVQLTREEGLPDGMASDAQGCVWIAVYGGGAVRRYSPDGAWIGTIHLPVKAVTSCAFAGDDWSDLYITTAWHVPKWALPSPRENAGSVFRCRPGIAGAPVYAFAG